MTVSVIVSENIRFYQLTFYWWIFLPQLGGSLLV